MLKKKNLLRTTIVSLSALLAAQAYAWQPGVYLGVQAGWGIMAPGGISSDDMNSLLSDAFGNNNFIRTSFLKKHTGSSDPAGRVYAGYQWGPFFAAEMGWAQMPGQPVKSKAAGIDLDTGLPFVAATSGHIRTDAFDFAFKGIFPLQGVYPPLCHFNLYGKLGAAYISARSHESVTVTEPGVAPFDGFYNDKKHKFFPTFTLGAGYDFSPYAGVDLSWYRIQKVSDSPEIGSMDLISLGLTGYIG